MIVLGIDPGTALTGWGVVEKLKSNKINFLAHGCIKTSPLLAMPNRLLGLKRELNEVVSKYAPANIVVERLFFNSNAKTAMSVGQARGIVMLVAAEFNVDFFEYTSLQAKKQLTGYGRASKQDMQLVVKDFLGLKEKIRPDDAADALAMAIFHCQRI